MTYSRIGDGRYSVCFWAHGSWGEPLFQSSRKGPTLEYAERMVAQGTRIALVGLFTPAGNNVADWWARGGCLNI